MLQIPSHHLLLFIPVLVTLSISPSSTSQQQCRSPTTTPEQVRAGYWLPHSNHYSPLSQIDSSLFTHLYYHSSLPLDGGGDFRVDLPFPDQLPLLASFSTTLKNRNPHLKTLLSISTAAADQQSNFSAMASSATNRAAFIGSTIELARTYAFDGLDLAWQFPLSSSDMANLGLLVTEWRARVDEEAEKFSPSLLLLTATVYFSGHLFDRPSDDLDYPIDALSKSLDWANALCFGYHSNNDEVTAADAALYDLTSHLSTSYGISSWLDAGLPPCKLVMGIPLYGRSWFLKNKMKNGMGAQVVAAGPRQKLSNQTGIMAYFEIESSSKDTAAELVYDNRTVSAYFHAGGVWVSFDSPEVVKAKIAYALQNRLLGYFLWPISFDDSNYTISKQASDDWQTYQAPLSDDGSEQALSPVELPPSDLTLTKSDATSNSRWSSSATHLVFFFLFLCS